MPTLFAALVAFSLFVLGVSGRLETLPLLAKRGTVVINAGSTARALTAQATRLSGTYHISNAATGTSLQTDGDFDLFPGSQPADMVLYSSGQGTRIGTEGNKCLSAQWGERLHVDWSGVLYACQVGPGNGGGGLEPAKQWWLLIPAHTAAPVSKKPTVAKRPSRTRSSHEVESHHEIRHGSHTRRLESHAIRPEHHETHHHAASHHHESHHRHHRGHKRAEIVGGVAGNHTLEGRSGGGTYFIIPTDHLANMATRALTASRIRTGTQTSTVLAAWNQADPHQMWTFTPA